MEAECLYWSWHVQVEEVLGARRMMRRYSCGSAIRLDDGEARSVGMVFRVNLQEKVFI